MDYWMGNKVGLVRMVTINVLIRWRNSWLVG